VLVVAVVAEAEVALTLQPTEQAVMALQALQVAMALSIFITRRYDE
jgi:hypothetical protein